MESETKYCFSLLIFNIFLFCIVCHSIFYQGIEETARQKKMSVVGVADLDKRELEELFNWAKVSRRYAVT